MPAGYRDYQPGWCQNPACQKDLGLVSQYGGRDRKYCNDNCKVQASRRRKKEAAAFEQAKLIRQELREGWQLDDETLRLVARLADYGPGAIREGVNLALAVASSMRAKAEKRGVFL